MISIPLPYLEPYKFYLALNKSAKEVSDFLFEQEIPLMEIVEYITDKTPNVNGKTTLFKKNNLILVKMDYFNNSIRYISILVHELKHVSDKVIGDCKREESEAYLLEYIFEEIMKKLKPDIDYTDEPRDMEWLEKMIK